MEQEVGFVSKIYLSHYNIDSYQLTPQHLIASTSYSIDGRQSPNASTFHVVAQGAIDHAHIRASVQTNDYGDVGLVDIIINDGRFEELSDIMKHNQHKNWRFPIADLDFPYDQIDYVRAALQKYYGAKETTLHAQTVVNNAQSPVENKEQNK
ncbi:hypothetical protein HPP92_015883 [Vanilla planifolia]|uniref:Uncharacterized protein n=1 Tax=Vanilla planifolia TaxID=51239 RepID=A0A835URI9_VANPL|nr:hypothetical protein HPP92_015883 [Vanilla planifolia]